MRFAILHIVLGRGILQILILLSLFGCSSELTEAAKDAQYVLQLHLNCPAWRRAEPVAYRAFSRAWLSGRVLVEPLVWEPELTVPLAKMSGRSLVGPGYARHPLRLLLASTIIRVPQEAARFRPLLSCLEPAWQVPSAESAEPSN
jgi:hypothetical protein